MLRDFSNSSKQNLLGLVSQVENEKWSDFTDWMGDRWYDFEEWIGNLNIKNYINDVNNYHKKVIDKNNATKESIEKIFSKVNSVNHTYSSIFNNVEYTLQNIQKYVVEMNQIVSPRNGRFHANAIGSNLKSILSDIEICNAQNLKERMIQEIDGEVIFNKELIYEYIKKDPNELSSEEKEILIDVLEELQDIVTIYEKAASCGTDELGAETLRRVLWVSESEKYNSFTGASVHYNDIYVNVLNYILETSEDSNTFAASLVKISNGENDLNLLGAEFAGRAGKLFGGTSLAVYAAKYQSEHSEEYFLKLEASEKTQGKGLSGKIKLDAIKKRNEAIKDKLIDADKYEEIDRKTEYFDVDGNTVRKEIPDYYDKEFTIGELKEQIGVSGSIYEGAFDLGDFGNVDAVIGNAEAHGSISAGLYVSKTDKNGETVRVFSPGIDAEIGASITALEVGWENQLLGDKNFGLNADAKVIAGKAEAKANIGAQLYGEDGELNVQLGASANAEAIAAEAKGSLGVNVLGGEVGVTGSVNVGVGAHAELGYKDGVFKFDVGASLGVGVSFGAEIDVGGMVSTVCDKAESAWDGIKDGWDNFWNKW